MIKSSAKRSKKPREPMFISPLHVHFYISRLESDKMILNLFFEKNSRSKILEAKRETYLKRETVRKEKIAKFEKSRKS